MNYEEKYKEALERFKSFKEKYYTKDTNFGDVIFDKTGEMQKDFESIFPELNESDDERIRRKMLEHFRSKTKETWCNMPVKDIVAYLEKQKENLKSADSIPSNCVSNAKCDDRWHKVTDSLPDNGRLVLAKDCLGNVLLARYDGENWEVNVYDNEDHYCHNSISKWCEIPSEKQKDLTTENIYKHSRERMSFYNGQQKEQKPEWSEEDENCIRNLESVIYYDKNLPTDTRIKLGDFLKSLRPSWKPSEEQMKALQNAVALTACDKELARLYNQLQKLGVKEEPEYYQHFDPDC